MKNSKFKNPKTPAKWQDAVDAAHVYLLIDSARKYGLVEGGPEIDIRAHTRSLRP